jgi:hypothetical protein
MKKILLLLTFSFIFSAAPSSLAQITRPLIIDHQCTKLQQIPSEWIDSAKSKLHIAYGHTSHGSQLTTGMTGLVSFAGSQYEWNNGGSGGALDLHDRGISGASDLGNPNRTAWADATKNYLNNSSYSDVNVIIWSWCGQVSSASEADINTYLSLMNQLEIDFPNVMFVYMTGHLDGSGLTGNLHLRNEQIRNYCSNNDKILYDFADIEAWDPDLNYFGDKIPNDNCDYDTDGNGSRDGNWAIEWQNAHTEGVDWYDCPSAHSQPLNANQKAYAAWWLWASLAGWTPLTNISDNERTAPKNFVLEQNYPNPFNPTTTIKYEVPSNLAFGQAGVKSESLNVKITVYNIIGNELAVLVDQQKSPGTYEVVFNSDGLSSGVYFYKLTAGNYTQSRKMILLK